MNARIDEFTPPGIARHDRSNTVAFDANPAPVHTVGMHPACSQATGSQGPMPRAVALEHLTAIKRAGADIVLTYFARWFAESVANGRIAP